ncbi:MAG: hypothetical protein IAE82_08810 [Opitutaceae bacterium]|nr:hypothetical protein [Opitutaceae bacterium]
MDKFTVVFPLKLRPSQKRRLKRLADKFTTGRGNQSAYIRYKVFGEDAGPSQTRPVHRSPAAVAQQRIIRLLGLVDERLKALPQMRPIDVVALRLDIRSAVARLESTPMIEGSPEISDDTTESSEPKTGTKSPEKPTGDRAA